MEHIGAKLGVEVMLTHQPMPKFLVKEWNKCRLAAKVPITIVCWRKSAYLSAFESSRDAHDSSYLVAIHAIDSGQVRAEIHQNSFVFSPVGLKMLLGKFRAL